MRLFFCLCQLAFQIFKTAVLKPGKGGVGVKFSVELAVVNNGGVFFFFVELTCDQVKTLRFTKS